MTRVLTLIAAAALLLAACEPQRAQAPNPSPSAAAPQTAPPEAPPASAPPPSTPPDDLPLGLNHPAFLQGIPGEGPLQATLETSRGAITCVLLEAETPTAVANFVGLARGLKPFLDPATQQPVKRPFYDGLTFHRVVPDYLIQTGDPTGTAAYNPGYRFNSELRDDLRFDAPGALAYANTGPDTNGAQLFITARPAPELQGRYVLFGRCDNPDLIHEIAAAPTGPRQLPLSPLRLERVTLRRGPAPAPTDPTPPPPEPTPTPDNAAP